jgi:nitroreductase
MDGYLAVVSKREVRTYAPRPLEPAVERQILDAGRVAGSSKNRQSRRFVVLRDPALVEEAAASVYNAANVRGAALVVAIVVGGKGPLAFDAGRAAQNIMVAANALGVGSSPNGVADPERLRAAVGHGDDESIATVLSLGYPATPRDPSRRTPDEWIAGADRKPYEEVVEER